MLLTIILCAADIHYHSPSSLLTIDFIRENLKRIVFCKICRHACWDHWFQFIIFKCFPCKANIENQREEKVAVSCGEPSEMCLLCRVKISLILRSLLRSGPSFIQMLNKITGFISARLSVCRKLKISNRYHFKKLFTWSIISFSWHFFASWP